MSARLDPVSTTSFAGMLSEMRKYRVGLVLAHQYMEQLDESLRGAILGNVGTTIAFRVGLTDAEVLEKEFHPEFAASDFVNLPDYHVYLKLMIDGVVSKPFSAVTHPAAPATWLSPARRSRRAAHRTPRCGRARDFFPRSGSSARPTPSGP